MFQSDAQRGNNALANSIDHASPPHRIFRLGLPCQPASNKSRHVTGVACMKVAPHSLISAARRELSAATSLDAIVTHAPAMSGKYSSKPAISNDNEVIETSLSSASILAHASWNAENSPTLVRYLHALGLARGSGRVKTQAISLVRSLSPKRARSLSTDGQKHPDKLLRRYVAEDDPSGSAGSKGPPAESLPR